MTESENQPDHPTRARRLRLASVGMLVVVLVAAGALIGQHSLVNAFLGMTGTTTRDWTVAIPLGPEPEGPPRATAPLGGRT